MLTHKKGFLSVSLKHQTESRKFRKNMAFKTFEYVFLLHFFHSKSF